MKTARRVCILASTPDLVLTLAQSDGVKALTRAGGLTDCGVPGLVGV